MNKALKILKIVLLSLLGLIIVAIVAGVIIYQTTFKEPMQQMLSSIDSMIESGELFEAADSPETPGTSAVPSVSPDAAEEPENPASSGTSAPPAASAPPSGAKMPKKPAKEYKSTYDYVKDNVTPSDFSKGSNFASRVDVGYILGLLSGGLTKAEKAELKQYLSARFSQSEINEGIALYKKYSYLLKN